jgi:hypothetical protein
MLEAAPERDGVQATRMARKTAHEISGLASKPRPRLPPLASIIRPSAMIHSGNTSRAKELERDLRFKEKGLAETTLPVSPSAVCQLSPK